MEIMKKLSGVDLVKIGTVSRKMSDLARTWHNDAESNRLAALSEKLLLLPKVSLDDTDKNTLKLYLTYMEKQKEK
jgi:hypothetical protein